jgi:hypothetical protein
MAREITGFCCAAAIVGEVFGGVVGGVCAIVLAAFSYFKAKRLLASWKKKRVRS